MPERMRILTPEGQATHERMVKLKKGGGFILKLTVTIATSFAAWWLIKIFESVV